MFPVHALSGSLPTHGGIRPASSRLTARLFAFAFGAALVAASVPIVSGAQTTVTVAVSDSTQWRVVPGGKIAIPLLVLPAGGANIAALQGNVTWGSSRLTFDSVKAGPFGTLTPNTTGAGGGSITLSSFRIDGRTTRDTVAMMYFTASATPGGTRMVVTPTVAGNEVGSNILPSILTRNLDVCVAQAGKWGDVNDDGNVNIIDAQQVARNSVGLSVANPTAMAARGDVTADGNTNIIDAQQIARFSVGLSAAARTGTNVFSAPTVASVTLTPGTTQTLTVGQNLLVNADPKDAGNVSLAGCAAVAWTSNDTTKARVSASGLVTAMAVGSATITATSGGQMATLNVTVNNPTAGAVATLEVVQGNNQVMFYNAAPGVDVTVRAKDAAGIPVPGIPINFAVQPGGGTINAVSSVILTTDALGQSALEGTWIMPPSGTSASVVASVGGAVTPVTITVSLIPNITIAHSCVLLGGTVNCTGAGTRGQMGNGTNTSQFVLAPVTGGLTFTQLAKEGRGDHMCAITGAGAAYCWGYNQGGALGDGTRTDRNVPTQVAGAQTFTKVSVGGGHTCALTSAGDAYCWGHNIWGQVSDTGLGTAITAPVKVTKPAGVVFAEIAAGGNHTCAATAADDVYCWGRNVSGNIGDGSTVNRPLPARIAGGTLLTKLSVGANHTCGLTAAGAAFCWGQNGSGQIGDGSTISRLTAVAVGGGHVFSQITAAGFTNCASKADGQLWCWGANQQGQLGDQSASLFRSMPGYVGVNGTVVVGGGFGIGYFCAAHAPANAVFCWGGNTSGQLGDGTTVNRNEPRNATRTGAAAGTAVSVVASALSAYQTGPAGGNVPSIPTATVRDGLGNPVAGVTVTFSVQAGGGSIPGGTSTTDVNGVTGPGSWTLGATPGLNILQATISVPGGTAKALFVVSGTSAAGSVVKVSGDSIYAPQQGNPNVWNPPTVRVLDGAGNAIPNAAVTFTLGASSGSSPSAPSGSVVVIADAGGYASFTNWNPNRSVAGGVSTVSATVTGAATPAVFTAIAGPTTNIASDRLHSCEIAASGAIYCWGTGTRGQVGDGANAVRNTAVAVSGGLTFTKLADGQGGHRCAIATGGAAYCWGANDAGQIGNNQSGGGTTSQDVNVPTAVSGGFSYTQLSAQGQTTCGIATNGQVYCWGWLGSTGMFNSTKRGRTASVPTLVNTGGLTFTGIALTDDSFCGMTSAGVVYCAGDGAAGQIGDGNFEFRATLTAVTGSVTFSKITGGTFNICGLSASGQLYCWGSGQGSIGDGTVGIARNAPTLLSSGPFVDVQMGNFSGCARQSSGIVYCWGVNNAGQVGDGTFNTALLPVPIPGWLFASVRAQGFRHRCGKVASGLVYCWGGNQGRELGDGSTTTDLGRASPVAVVGWPDGPAAGTAVSIQAGAAWVNGLPTAIAGTVLGVAPQVIVRDRLGAPVAGVSVAFAVASGGGTIIGTPAMTDGTGTATSGNWTLGAGIGTQTVTATVTGLPPVTLGATALSSPGSIALLCCNNQLMTSGGTYPAGLSVLISDASNNPIAGFPVTFTITAGGGFVAGSPTSATVLTLANGIASAILVAPPSTPAGVTQTITATATGLAPVTFTARSVGTVAGDARCELNSTGAAFCWGPNSRGQIGDGTTVNKLVPTAVGGGLTFASLGQGSGEHACGLTAAGAAYCWGANSFGQLGDNTTTDRTAPTLVSGGLTFSSLAIGSATTCGLNAAGAIYCWGWASYGFFGDSILGVSRPTPTLVNTGGLVFTQISVGFQHICGIASTGAVWCAGLNNAGQLGNGTNTSSPIGVPLNDGRTYSQISVSGVGGLHSCGLTTGGAVFCWGANTFGQLGNNSTTNVNFPVAVSGGLTFASISVANVITCARTAAGSAYCWGQNGAGQLGDGTTVNKLVPAAVLGGINFSKITVGPFAVCGRSNGGNAQPYCWGQNNLGQVGDNTTTNRSLATPVRWVEGSAGVAASMVFSNAAGIVQGAVTGANVPIAPSVLVRDYLGNPVAGVSVSFTPTAGGGSVTGSPAVTNASGIATLGNWTLGGTVGQNTLTATAPGTLPAPVFTAQATGSPGSVSISSGDNQVNTNNALYLGQLTVIVRDGTSAPMPNVGVTYAVASGGGSISGSAVAFTDANGLARVTGVAPAAAAAQTITATVVGLTPVTFNLRSAGAAGGDTRCELNSAGAAYCWGVNSRGQIGDGTTTTRLIPTAVGGGITFASLAEGGGDHACGLTAAGAAYCWGANSFGQLGDNTITDRTTPTLVSGGLVFTKLVLSSTSTCGRTAAGALHCWGWAGNGIYADGAIGITRLVPTAVTIGALTFNDMSVSAQHMCGVSSTGAMYCWGNNGNGQVGDNTFTSPRTAVTLVTGGLTFSSVSLGTSYSCGLTTGGAAYCWGSNGNGQLGENSTGQRSIPTLVTGGLTFASISATSSSYTCARTTAGAAYCWGFNSSGQLGDGTTTQRTAPTAVLGGITFGKVTIRVSTTCGRAASGNQQPFCWGSNGSGSVGDNSTTQRTSPVPVTWVEGTPGTAVSMVITAGNFQGAVGGSAVPIAPSVVVKDYANNPVAGVSVTFAPTPGTAWVTGSPAVTNASGIATLGSWTLGAGVGTNTLTASAAGVPSPVFTAQATLAPASITISSGDNQVQNGNNTYAAQVAVLVRDGSNVALANVGVTFAVASGGGSISGSSLIFTDASGFARANVITPAAAGIQTVTATASGLAPITFNLRSAGAIGSETRCELTSAGAAYCWGVNNRGQIGDGTTTNRLIPTAVGGGITFASLAEGAGDHACGLTGAGAAYCWGANSYGQLGDNTITDRSAPTLVNGGLVFTKLVLSSTSTCGRTAAGALYCWGWAGVGIYGDGAIGITRLVPTAVVLGALTFTDMAVSPHHMCGVASTGAMYCWGWNQNGQVGDGTTTSPRTAVTAVSGGLTFSSVTVGSSYSCGVTSAGAAFCWGSNGNGQLGDNSTSQRTAPTAVTGGLTFASVSAAGATTCGRTTAGAARCWGWNGNGQLGDATTAQRTAPTPVLGGITFGKVTTRLNTACGRASAGNLQPFCWGLGGNGQVGDNTGTQRTTPVPVVWVEGTPGTAVSMVINAGNFQGAVGGSALPIAPSVLIKDFANTPVAGVSVTFTVSSGGGSVTGSPAATDASGIATLGSWTLGAAVGTNTLTASATGTPSPVFTAQATTAPANITISSGDNQVQSNGNGYATQLVVLVQDGSNTALANVGVTFAVAAGGGSISGSTLIFTDAGGFARANAMAPPTPGVQTVTATASGLAPVTFNLRSAGTANGETRCELNSAGAAYCWGVNNRGQIGDGTTTNRLVPTAVGGGITFASLAEGSGEHACGLTAAGVAYCWGANGFGQIGDNAITDRTAPTPVSGGLVFTKLVLSASATCGRTAAGALHCWGWAGNGIFADGSIGITRLVPTLVPTGALTFSDLAVSQLHMCGVASTGAMYCWGGNSNGQVGDGTITSLRTSATAVSGGLTFSSVSVGTTYTCGVTTAGAAYCWGFNSNGQLGTNNTSQFNVPTAVTGGLAFASISAASATTCARTTAGAAYCWGWNGSGQIGDGTTTQRNTPAAVSGGVTFGKVTARYNTACGRASAGNLQPFCWGNNGSGQVGDNSTAQRTNPVPVTWVEGTPGTAVSMVMNSGNNQSATAGSAVSVSVIVRDYAGNPVSGVTVATAVTFGAGSAPLSVITDGSGIATISWTLASTAGANTLNVSLAGIGSVVFNATGTFPLSASVTTPTLAFAPITVDIANTGSVTWNLSSIHTVIFDTGGAPANIAAPTTTDSRSFTSVGTFNYHCSVHPSMTGTVIVH